MHYSKAHKFLNDIQIQLVELVITNVTYCYYSVNFTSRNFFPICFCKTTDVPFYPNSYCFMLVALILMDKIKAGASEKRLNEQG
jgi:hypothetical protein